MREAFISGVGPHPRNWLGSVAAVVIALVVGAAAGGLTFQVTQSVLVVSIAWAAIGLIACVLWGARVAALFIIPTTIAAVTGELTGTAPVDPAFYSTAGTIAPVLLVALGLEQWSLRREANTPFEKVLFVLLLLYVIVSIGASLYGSATCSSSGSGCLNVIFSIHILRNAYFDATATDLTASGIAGGLAAMLSLAAIAHKVGDEADP